MRRRGFTLIELLAVIAIVLLLASLLFPMLAEAYERARQVQCLGNLKTQGTATVVFAGDHDGNITRWSTVEEIEAAGRPYGGWSYYGWFEWPVIPVHSVMLSYYRIDNEFWCGSAGLFNQQYVKDNRPFYCPGDPVRHAVTDTEDPHYGRYGFYKNSDSDPKISQSYWFNPAQSFRLGERRTTRVGGGYAQNVYPFVTNPHNEALLMDPVAKSASMTYHRAVWQTFNYDGSATRRASGELGQRLALLPAADFDSWYDIEEQAVPLLAE